MDTVRIAFFIGVLLFFFPVSYALQEPLAESSAYEPRMQSSLVSSLSGLLRTILDLTDSIRTFISLVPVMISVTMNALSKLAAGELEYRDVAWCFDIIEVLAQELSLSRTYDAFVRAVMALTTGSLTVDDVYEILRVLPPLMRESPRAIARWLSIAYNLGFEVIFAPIAGGIVGLGIGAVAGLAILLVSILFFPAIAIILSILSAIGLAAVVIVIAIALILLAVAIFIGFDIFLFILMVILIIFLIVVGLCVGAVIGFIIASFVFLVLTIILWWLGFIWTIAGLLMWLLIFLLVTVIVAFVGFMVGALLAIFVLAAAVIIEVLLFCALLLVIFFIFIASSIFGLVLIGALLAIGLALALFIGLPVGIIVGIAAFVCITAIMILLFTIGYPLMRWASLTGAL